MARRLRRASPAASAPLRGSALSALWRCFPSVLDHMTSSAILGDARRWDGVSCLCHNRVSSTGQPCWPSERSGPVVLRPGRRAWDGHCWAPQATVRASPCAWVLWRDVLPGSSLLGRTRSVGVAVPSRGTALLRGEVGRPLVSAHQAAAVTGTSLTASLLAVHILGGVTSV